MSIFEKQTADLLIGILGECFEVKKIICITQNIFKN